MKKFVRFTNNRNEFSLCFPSEKSDFLGQKQILGQKNRLLCAVSGGQDSIIIFFIFVHLFFPKVASPEEFSLIRFFNPRFLTKASRKKKNDIEFKKILFSQGKTEWLVCKKLFLKMDQQTNDVSKFEVLYCQHFLQPKNFLCPEFLFEFSFLGEVEYALILPQEILLTENHSQKWRKNNFSRFLQLKKLSTLVTGQTETDSLERSLTNLFRGTSPNSLSQPIILNSKTAIHLFFCNVIFKPRMSWDDNWIKFNRVNKTLLKLKKDLTLLLKPSILKRKSIRLRKSFSFSKKNSNKKNTEENQKFISVNLLKPLKSRKGKQNVFFYSSTSLETYKYKFQNYAYSSQSSISYSFCFSNRDLKKKVTFIKPLRNVNRYTVSKLVNLYKLPVSSDITNFSASFYRNKIRHHLIPFIRFLFQNNVESLLTKFLFLVSQEHEQLENQVFELKMILKILRVVDKIKNKKTLNRFKQHLKYGIQKKQYIDKIAFCHHPVPQKIVVLKNEASLVANEVFEKGTTEIFWKKKWASLILTTQTCPTLKRSLLQKAISNYIEIELNFSQISQIQIFIF